MKPRNGGKCDVYWMDCMRLAGKKKKRYCNKQTRREWKKEVREQK